MDFFKADNLTFDPRPQMAAIFVECFYSQGLKSISKSKIKLARALAHSFNLNYFYIAITNEQIMGFAALTIGKSPLKLDKKTLMKELGFIKGQIAYFALNKFMINHKYPFEISKGIGVVEFVATSPKHQKKGVASGIIKHIIHENKYSKYILEVADSNAPAIRVYKRLGFSEFRRVPAPKLSGFKYLLYMMKKSR